MTLRLRIVTYLVLNWPALLWTLIGGLGLRWCWKLCRRWIPAYRHYKLAEAPQKTIAYARSRMWKSIDVTIILVTAVSVGAVVLASPMARSGERTARYYIVIFGLLFILALVTHIAFLMNREDEEGSRPDISSQLEERLVGLERGLDRIEGEQANVAQGRIIIADNLVEAQQALEAIKVSNEKSRLQADAVPPSAEPGKAADAASRSPEEPTVS